VQLDALAKVRVLLGVAATAAATSSAPRTILDSRVGAN
jgi:hypothetical protein